MDITVDGKTINVNSPDLKNTGQPKAKGTDFAALLQQQKETQSAIMDKGFGKYITDVQMEKFEKEIREKVLTALGLTEESLVGLPAKQRAGIEKTIQQTIVQEMQARMEELAQQNKEKQGVSSPFVANEVI